MNEYGLTFKIMVKNSYFGCIEILKNYKINKKNYIEKKNH